MLHLHLESTEVSPVPCSKPMSSSERKHTALLAGPRNTFITADESATESPQDIYSRQFIQLCSLHDFLIEVKLYFCL